MHYVLAPATTYVAHIATVRSLLHCLASPFLQTVTPRTRPRRLATVGLAHCPGHDEYVHVHILVLWPRMEQATQ